jgi:hypothetical protein
VGLRWARRDWAGLGRARKARRGKAGLVGARRG